MTGVYFDPSVGGDGSTVTDDTNPNTGLDAGGHRTRFIPALVNVVAVVKTMLAAVKNAIVSSGVIDQSATSLTIALGNQTFGTNNQTTKLWSLGQTVVIASTASPQNQMIGVITSFNSASGQMNVLVQYTTGSGTFAAWTISLSASIGSYYETELYGDAWFEEG